jgi:hypothetical protein
LKIGITATDHLYERVPDAQPWLIRIAGLPPYINTKKLTKPLLQVGSKKKLKRDYWVHFSLENGCTVDCIWSRAIP